MASVILPLRDDLPAYTFRADLSSTEYLFEIRWNERDGAHYLSLFDVDGVAIANGIKIVIGMPLLRRVSDERRPPGDIVALDSTDTDTEAEALGDLGDEGARVVLVYTDPNE